MDSGHPIAWLMFATLAAAIVIAVVLLARHRAKHGVHPMAGKRERNIDEILSEKDERK